MIRKSYVVAMFGNLATAIFSDSGKCLRAKVNLQTFRYGPDGKIC